MIQIRNYKLGGTGLVKELGKASLKKQWLSRDMKDEKGLIRERGDRMSQVEETECTKALWAEDAGVCPTGFPDNDWPYHNGTPHSSFYNVTLISIHREVGSMFPPLEFPWACDCSRGDTVWLPRLNPKIFYLIPWDLATILWGSHKATCKSPSRGPSWQRVSSSRHVSEWDLGWFQLQPLSCCSWHEVKQTWTAPTRPCPNCIFMSKINIVIVLNH